MKKVLGNDGLSARRRAIHQISKIILNVTHICAIPLAMLVILSSCQEKSNGQDQNVKKDQAAIAKDSLNKPKVNIEVNKHYDDKGNLIGFDSTYSSYYSNVKGDTAGMDTLMHSFDRYFNMNHASFFNDEFRPLFFNDSSRYPDFFHHDYFMKRYELNDAYMRKMMKDMDSIKNHFYKERSGHAKKSQHS